MKIKIFDKPHKQTYTDFENEVNNFINKVHVISTTVNSNVSVGGDEWGGSYDFQYVVTIFYKGIN